MFLVQTIWLYLNSCVACFPSMVVDQSVLLIITFLSYCAISISSKCLLRQFYFPIFSKTLIIASYVWKPPIKCKKKFQA